MLLFCMFFLYLTTCKTTERNILHLVESRIREGAHYGCDVLLDKKGQAKCDYHMFVGKYVSSFAHIVHKKRHPY